MTAAVIALSFALAAAVALAVALGVSLRNALTETADQRRLADGYRSDRDEGVRQLGVAQAELATERKLRTAAELQRNAAVARLREQLAHLPPEQIDAEVSRLFGTPIQLTPGNELETP